MTCASCAARIEKKLNRMDGVSAVVNYATGTAHVTTPADLDPAELVAAVERTGYAAQLPAPPEREPTAEADEADERADQELAGLRRRLVVGAALGLPVLLLAMVPALRFENWQGSAWCSRRPVAVWARVAPPPCRGDQRAARRGDDGHAGQPRRRRRLPVVAVRPAGPAGPRTTSTSRSAAVVDRS